MLLNKTFGLLIFSLLCTLSAMAQKATLSGYVTDTASGEALPGAVIYVPELKQGVVTNNYGFYSLTLPKRKFYAIQISYIGFEKKTDSLYLTEDQEYNVALKILQLKNVVVKAPGPEGAREQLQMSRTDISIQQIRQMPALLGEVDVIKSLQLLPGIQKGADGAAGLYVRGGGPDQNLILLDGVPVYNSSHLFGFVSVFNADAINSVQLYKGGFPARFGGRLSSVLDITMKEGNAKKFSGSVSLGPVTGKLSLEGPLYKDKTTFAISARRTFLDLLTNFALAGTGAQLGIYFYDVNAKINHKFSQKDRLFFSIYGGRDKLYVGYTDTFRTGNGNVTERLYSTIYWGNLTSTMRYNHIFNARLFSNTSLLYSRYRFTNGNEYERTQFLPSGNVTDKFSLTYYSGIQDIGAKTDFDYIPKPSRHVRFGAAFTTHLFNPGALDLVLSSPGSTFDTLIRQDGTNVGHELAAYLESDETLSSNFKMNVGLRLSGLATGGKFYLNPEPRVSFRLLTDEFSSIKASYARMAQYIHLLANSGTSLPTDLWVPATARIAPQTSHQVAAGYTRNFAKAWEFSFETYYKWLNNVIDYKEGAAFGDLETNWEDQVEQGKGTAYGFEFLLNKKAGKYTGWIGYTLSWSKRRFPTINRGEEFPYKYDRRHDLSVVITRQVGRKSSVSAAYVYSSGAALTMPVGQYPDLNGNVIYYYGSKNNFRMRNYSRLDFTINALIDETSRLEHYFTFSLYNLLFRQNPFYVYVSNINGKNEVVQLSLFPFAIPSVSYGIKF